MFAEEDPNGAGGKRGEEEFRMGGVEGNEVGEGDGEFDQVQLAKLDSTCSLTQVLFFVSSGMESYLE